MAALDNNANVQPISGQNAGQRRKLNPPIMPITLQQSRASSGIAAGGGQISGIPPVSILIPPQTVSTLDLSAGSWFVSVLDAGSFPGTIHPDIRVYGMVSEVVTIPFQKLRLNPPIAPWTVTNTQQVLLSAGKTRLHLAHESRSALMFVVRPA